MYCCFSYKEKLDNENLSYLHLECYRILVLIKKIEEKLE